MLTYEPHKGKFHSAAIDGDTYMFVAAAHHCLPSRQKKYGCDKKNQDPSECIMEQFNNNDFCPAFNSPCPLLETCESEYKTFCNKRKKLLCETKICIHDHITNKTEPNPVFSDFYAFREKLIKEKILVVTKIENKHSLWSKVCFQNYIQTITTNIDNDQNIIEEKYLKLFDYKKVKGSSVRCNINEEAFKKNCTDIKPDVIVVLHYKQIKEEIEKILHQKLKSFSPILQLSEENRYYVYAHTKSNLYKRFNERLLKDYENFKPKNKKGNDFSYNGIAVAITYHRLEIEGKLKIKDKNELQKEIQRIFSKIKEKYPKLIKKTFDKEFNRLRDYIEDGKNHDQSQLLDCYNQLVDYWTKRTEWSPELSTMC